MRTIMVPVQHDATRPAGSRVGAPRAGRESGQEAFNMHGVRLPHWLVQVFKYAAGIAATALLAFLFVRDVKFREVWRTIGGADLLLLAPVACTFLLSYWLQAW